MAEENFGEALIKEIRFLITQQGGQEAARGLSHLSAQLQVIGRTAASVQTGMNKFFTSFGAGTVSMRSGVKALDDYNRQLLQLRNISAGTGKGFGTIRRDVEALSKEFRFQRAEIGQMYTAYNRMFAQTGGGFKNMRTLIKGITAAVGENAAAVQETMGVIDGLINRYAALEPAFERLGGRGTISALAAGGTSSYEETSRLLTLLGGGRKGDQGIAGANENIRALNSIRQQAESVNLEVGKMLSPVVNAIGGKVDTMSDNSIQIAAKTALISEGVSEVIGYLGGILALLGSQSVLGGARTVGGMLGRGGAGAAGGAVGGRLATAGRGAGRLAGRAALPLAALYAAGESIRFAWQSQGVKNMDVATGAQAYGQAIWAEQQARIADRNSTGSARDMARSASYKSGAASARLDEAIAGQSYWRKLFGAESGEVKRLREESEAATKEARRLQKIWEETDEYKASMLDITVEELEVEKAKVQAAEDYAQKLMSIQREQKISADLSKLSLQLLQKQISLFRSEANIVALTGNIGAGGQLALNRQATSALTAIRGNRAIAARAAAGAGARVQAGAEGFARAIGDDSVLQGGLNKLYGGDFLGDFTGGSSAQKAAMARLLAQQNKGSLEAAGLTEGEISRLQEEQGLIVAINDAYGEQLAAQETINRALQEAVDVEKQLLSFADQKLALDQAGIGLQQAQVSLAENLAMGVGPSAEMRMQAVSAIQEKIATLREKMEMIDSRRTEAMAIKDAEERKARLLYLDTQRLEVESEIVNSQQQQAQMLKSIRDGYISAIAAMTTGAGVFTKILFTQDQNLGILMRSVGAVPTAIRTGADVGGYRESERYGAGQIMSNEERRRQAFKTDTPMAELFGNSLAENAKLGLGVVEESLKDAVGEAAAFGANAIAQGEITGAMTEVIEQSLNNAFENVAKDPSSAAADHINRMMGSANIGRSSLSSGQVVTVRITPEQIPKLSKQVAAALAQVMLPALESINISSTAGSLEELARGG